MIQFKQYRIINSFNSIINKCHKYFRNTYAISININSEVDFMNLSKNGKLLCDLRKIKGMTQKEVADILGIVPKTVSKWETGHGFPDVSTLSALADILGVSEKTILLGDLKQNLEEAGNMKRTKFYVCPDCGSFMQGVANFTIIVIHMACLN